MCVNNRVTQLLWAQLNTEECKYPMHVVLFKQCFFLVSSTSMLKKKKHEMSLVLVFGQISQPSLRRLWCICLVRLGRSAWLWVNSLHKMWLCCNLVLQITLSAPDKEHPIIMIKKAKTLKLIKTKLSWNEQTHSGNNWKLMENYKTS